MSSSNRMTKGARGAFPRTGGWPTRSGDGVDGRPSPSTRRRGRSRTGAAVAAPPAGPPARPPRDGIGMAVSACPRTAAEAGSVSYTAADAA